MDAKPQRPVRSVRLRNDENLVPVVPGNKTIHQRNKSSPALSTMVSAGGLKAAAKRTAFGDVSNSVNGVGAVRASKDDNVLPPKDGMEVPVKPFNVLQDKKSTALLRPAQRPLTVSGPKFHVNSVSVLNEVEASSRPSAETVALPQPGNSRKVLTKRTTTVFKDQPLPIAEESESKAVKAKSSTASTALVHQTLAPAVTKQPITSTAAPELEPKTSRELPANSSDPVQYEEKQDLPPVLSESDILADLRSDGIYIDGKGDILEYPEQSFPQAHQHVVPLPETAKVTLKASDRSTANEMPAVTTMSSGHIADHAPLRYSQLPPLSEPEEYWDDEEEIYEEEGYVTARSYRSRGENTTGAATTILFPKVNQKVRRELAAAKQLVEATRTQEDIDDECYDTSMVAEYGDEIFAYMRELEIKMLPNAHYMDNQAEIQWSMRSVLMDWLVQVHGRFSLLPETLFLCVNYIDRFLSCKIVSLGKLQLVGATAIFIAAKYEEINCPSVQEVVYMVDGGYTIDEILKAERFMLSMLQFELGWPGPMSFLRRISKADDYDLETRTLAKYFLEITIMDERFVGSPPSFVAAGAHCLARMMLKKGIWTPAHVYYSGYTYSQLYPLVSLVVECCENPLKHHNAVYDKYSDKRYKRASFFVDAEMKKGFKLPGTTKELSSAHLYDFLDDGVSWQRT